MVANYDNLERTNFPSLYAATQPGDDFAEAFASDVHVVLQRRPWQVLIYKNGALQKDVGPCWDEPRCAAKRALLEQMLGRWPLPQRDRHQFNRPGPQCLQAAVAGGLFAP